MLAILFDPAMMRDFVAIYGEWRQTVIGTPAAHTCTSQCRSLRRGGIHICRLSGNLHVCTPTLCNAVVQRNDLNICSLTRTQFPSDMVISSDLYGASNSKDGSTIDFRKQETLVPKLNHRKGHRPKPRYDTRHIPMLVESSERLMHNVLARGLVVHAETTRLSNQQQRKRSSQTAGFVDDPPGGTAAKRLRMTTQRHIPRKQPIPLRQEEMSVEWRRFWTCCSIDTWQQINRTAEFKRQHNRYTFEIHCLVIWSFAAEERGFRCEAFCIPPDPLIRRSLPQEKDLPTLTSGLKCTTQSKNLFRKCVIELNKTSPATTPQATVVSTTTTTPFIYFE